MFRSLTLVDAQAQAPEVLRGTSHPDLLRSILKFVHKWPTVTVLALVNSAWNSAISCWDTLQGRPLSLRDAYTRGFEVSAGLVLQHPFPAEWRAVLARKRRKNMRMVSQIVQRPLTL